MGRKTIGEKKLTNTNTEKQKCYRDKQNKEVQRKKELEKQSVVKILKRTVPSIKVI